LLLNELETRKNILIDSQQPERLGGIKKKGEIFCMVKKKVGRERF